MIKDCCCVTPRQEKQRCCFQAKKSCGGPTKNCHLHRFSERKLPEPPQDKYCYRNVVCFLKHLRWLNQFTDQTLISNLPIRLFCEFQLCHSWKVEVQKFEAIFFLKFLSRFFIKHLICQMLIIYQMAFMTSLYLNIHSIFNSNIYTEISLCQKNYINIFKHSFVYIFSYEHIRIFIRHEICTNFTLWCIHIHTNIQLQYTCIK